MRLTQLIVSILLRRTRKHRRVPLILTCLYGRRFYTGRQSLRGFLSLKTLLKVIPLQSDAERTISPRILLSPKTPHLTDPQLMDVYSEKYDPSPIFMALWLITRVLLQLRAKKNHSHRAKNYHPRFAPDP
jgi:hypothetical protein